ncbi:MAG: metalloregulator ArsR/SmtB family transcription factor [Solirubrobacterales bacterium]
MDATIIHQQIARIAQAFSSPLRVRMLDLLVHRERSVDELRLSLSAPLTTVSSHLKILREARLVETRRDGARIHYRIADDSVVAALMALRDLGQARSLEVQEAVRLFLHDEQEMRPVGTDDLLEMMDRGEAVLIDVRPHDEFAAGHIPGAISAPLEDLDKHVGGLRRGVHVVAYCRDTFCVLAPKAVRVLEQSGLSTARLDIGFAEWSAGGRAIEHGEDLAAQGAGA